MFAAELERHARLLGLGMARALPLVWLVPAFGGPPVSKQLRLALAFGLSGLCLPILSAQLPADVWISPLVVLHEVLVGLVMGFLCACWFRAAELAGNIIDVVSGTASSSLGSPLGRGAAGPFANVMLLLAVVIFFEIGGIGHVTLALANSYKAMTPLAVVSPTSATRTAATTAILASAQLIESALGVSAPFLVALLLAELAVGLAGRAAPHMSIHHLAAPLKALLAVGVLLISIGTIEAAMRTSLTGFFALMRLAVKGVR